MKPTGVKNLITLSLSSNERDREMKVKMRGIKSEKG